MYRCTVCRSINPKGQPQRRHIVRRWDGSTEAEVPLCQRCYYAVADGVPLGELFALYAPKVPTSVVPSQPAPPPKALTVAVAPVYRRQGSETQEPVVQPRKPGAPIPIMGAPQRGLQAPPKVRCDICRKPVPDGTGQVTVESVLCEEHAQLARRAEEEADE